MAVFITIIKFSTPSEVSKYIDVALAFTLRDPRLNIILLFQNKQESVDAFVRGLLADSAQKSDRFMSPQLTDHLFEDSFGNSLDLASFNIQRGRDHGLPPYNIWRHWCDFSVASHFGIGPGGLIDHSFQAANQMKSIYA